MKSVIGHSWITHLLWWIAIATCARFHHTEAHSSPDANGKLHNAKDQNNGAQSHFCVKMVVADLYPGSIIVLVALCGTVLIVVWLIFIRIRVVVSINSNCYAVGNDDYSTKHS